jgi:hypothetical protein
MRNRIVLLDLGDQNDIARVNKLTEKLFHGSASLKAFGPHYVLNLPKPEDYAIFKASFDALKIDLSSFVKGLLLPNDNTSFYQGFLANVKKGQLLNLYEVLVQNPGIMEDLLPIIQSFDDEMLYTLKAYIENDCSPLLSSYQLYVHRNTISYRINVFSKKSGIELDTFSNILLIYQLVTFQLKNTLQTEEY